MRHTGAPCMRTSVRRQHHSTQHSADCTILPLTVGRDFTGASIRAQHTHFCSPPARLDKTSRPEGISQRVGPGCKAVLHITASEAASEAASAAAGGAYRSCAAWWCCQLGTWRPRCLRSFPGSAQPSGCGWAWPPRRLLWALRPLRCSVTLTAPTTRVCLPAPSPCLQQ